jgi:hypothetical protein
MPTVTSVFRCIAMIAASATLGGCMWEKVNYAGPRATGADVKTRQIDYWFDKPATSSVRANNFDALWNAINRITFEFSFVTDVLDYREGELTSKPLISKMPFEFWRHDVIDPVSQLQCSLITMRRTLHFQIHQADDGSYICEPKVVVEHYAMPERRITSVIDYQLAFSTQRPMITAATEEGDTPLPVEYWYAVGRDPALEKALADAVQRDLQAHRKEIVASSRDGE